MVSHLIQSKEERITELESVIDFVAGRLQTWSNAEGMISCSLKGNAKIQAQGNSKSYGELAQILTEAKGIEGRK